MKNRVYYGEYTLAHWIKLILTKNIGLPAYQRSFVWKEKDAKRLIKSIRDKQFVQPVTIALNCGEDDKVYRNLILDGQQRLTTIFLSYINALPIQSSANSENTANEDDSMDEETRSDVGSNEAVWNFSQLLNSVPECRDIEKIKEYVSRKIGIEYQFVDFKVDENFFKQNYLGFSYVVPIEQSEKEVQQAYTKLFRNINYFGRKLSCLESRRSLYYTKNELKNYFEGMDSNGEDVLCGLKIKEQMQYGKIDFLRYIAILSQYYALSLKGELDLRELMKGYSKYSYRETYYADYVSFILKLDQEDNDKKFDGFKFNEIFPRNEHMDRYAYLRECIHSLRAHMSLKSEEGFDSWIDADYWLFGLIYHVVFRGKRLAKNLERLQIIIQDEIAKVRRNANYQKSPNRLVHLRNRVDSSVKVFSDYVQ